MIHFVLVDDDAIYNEVAKQILKNAYPDCKVSDFLEAKLALKFLTSLKNIEQHLILLDLNMPEVDGWEFLEEFRTLHIEIPVVIVSSSIFLGDRERAEQYPEVKEYIAKPIDKNNVLGLDKIL